MTVQKYTRRWTFVLNCVLDSRIVEGNGPTLANRQISYIIYRVEFLIKEMEEGITYVIHQDAAVIRGTFGREKINGQRRVRGPVSRRHALRRPKISRVDSAHETLIQVHSYRHMAGLACRCNRRLKLGVQ